MTVDGRSPKRWLIGDPLPSEKLEAQLLSKRLALPIFASDALSSVAYAPQEMLMILVLGGVAFASFSPWVAAAVVILLATVVLSYRQLVKAYPSGGGDFEVAHKNLGEKAGLVVASALLVDYVMTVAVSVASGVDNIISALPVLSPIRVEMAVGFVILIAAVNLRGVRESGKAFAIPTYVFIGSVLVMIVTGLIQTALGHAPVAVSAGYGIKAESLTQIGMILLLLRAFSSGCSALTGVEAIANGVPAFRTPKIKNARQTLAMLGGIAIILFSGLVALSMISHIHYAESPCDLIGWKQCATQPQLSLMAQLAQSVFGGDSVMFFLIQAATALVLLLAANTAFNGFPLLGAVLARTSYAPKALNTRGDRLVFSNGMIILALAATALLIVYQANLTNLIQLYIIGVFVSFTLGQSGMVRHWVKLLKSGSVTTGRERRTIIRSLSINSFGAILTFVVLIVVTITKFTHGAYLVFIFMPILFILMLGVNRYYRDVDRETEVDATTTFGSKGDHGIVLVGKMQKPMLKALDYAIAARHESLEALHISTDDEATALLQKQWTEQNIKLPLTVVESPYREFGIPLTKYIRHRRDEHGSEVITVYVSQYIVGHWWETILHNHRARRIKQRLMLCHGVTVAIVPWLLDSSSLIYGRRSRPMPGDARRGELLRPVIRRPLTPATVPEPDSSQTNAPAGRKTSRTRGESSSKARGTSQKREQAEAKGTRGSSQKRQQAGRGASAGRADRAAAGDEKRGAASERRTAAGDRAGVTGDRKQGAAGERRTAAGDRKRGAADGKPGAPQEPESRETPTENPQETGSSRIQA